MTRILLLHTCRDPGVVRRTTKERLRSFLPSDIEVEFSWPRRWYQKIVDERSFGQAVPHIMAQVERHRKDYDAIVVNHHSDGGIEAVREMVGVPVVGMGEASVWMAGYLVDRFSMVTFGEGMRRIDKKIIQKMGLLSRLASIRVPLAELGQMEGDFFSEQNLPKLQKVIVQQCLKTAAEDGAQAVVIGGSGVAWHMPRITQDIQEGLAEEGFANIPIIEPNATAFHLAKMMVDLGLRRLP